MLYMLISLGSSFTYSQISTAKGFINEKSLVGFPLGILNKIDIPKFMNGLVKSITCSLKQGWMHNKQQVGNDNAIIGSMRREQGFFVRKSATRTEKIGKLNTFEQ